MGKFEIANKELKRILEKTEELGWRREIYIEPGQSSRTYVELGKYSPAGEDFSMVIDFDADNQVETFLKDLWDQAENFDVDDHVELWVPKRGKGGCPSTIRELMEDAEAIQAMIKELYGELEAI